MERSCLSYHINLFLFIAYSKESIRNFAPYNLRKHPAESLVLSKLDYNDIVFDPLPQYLMKGIQRVQNAASFVLARKRRQPHPLHQYRMATCRSASQATFNESRI